MVTLNTNSKESSMLRLIGIILAGTLFNLGLYFMLFFLAPIVSGAIVGYFVTSRREAFLFSLVSGIIAYIPLELLTAPTYVEYLIDEGVYSSTEIIQHLPSIYSQLAIAGIVLASIGIIGGLIGHSARMRTLDTQRLSID